VLLPSIRTDPQVAAALALLFLAPALVMLAVAAHPNRHHR
jgi:hypothetical protein